MSEAPKLELPPCVYMGEHEMLRGALSSETSFRLVVRGIVTAVELASLITLLQCQREVLIAAESEASLAPIAEPVVGAGK